MATNFQRESAKIYTFPPRGRLGLREAEHAADEDTGRGFAKVACGAGWYHDAAIEEERRSERKR